MAYLSTIGAASDGEKRAFITGRAHVKVQDITPALWEHLVHDVKEQLPVKEMTDKYRYLEHILVPDSRDGRMRRIEDDELLEAAREKVGLYHVTHFLKCSDISSIQSNWRNAPKKKDWETCTARGESALSAITDSVLLLPLGSSPKLAPFYRMDAVWTPVEQWDDNKMSSRPDTFHYELSEFKLVEIGYGMLGEFCSRPYDGDIPNGVHVLSTLMGLVQEHADSLESKRQGASWLRNHIWQMLQRMGS
jgi:hypothetical protein